ncbi:MAG: hypothetical protein M5R42_02025 [Rhodocyclaceae bacterium]|nr:hypothetical protein [Rhodocyclaceae bacterium]
MVLKQLRIVRRRTRVAELAVSAGGAHPQHRPAGAVRQVRLLETDRTTLFVTHRARRKWC